MKLRILLVSIISINPQFLINNNKLAMCQPQLTMWGLLESSQNILKQMYVSNVMQMYVLKYQF